MTTKAELNEVLDALDALANPPLLQRAHHTRKLHAGRTVIIRHGPNCPACVPLKAARELLGRYGR